MQHGILYTWGECSGTFQGYVPNLPIGFRTACPERKQTAPTNAAQVPVIAAGAGPPLLLLAGGQGGAKDKAGILRFELPETKSYGA
jgi:hypothetical protein